MTFLFKKPFIYVIMAVVFVIIVIQVSGVLNPKPTIAISSVTLLKNSVPVTQNTTLTVVLENVVNKALTAELRLIYGSETINFYDKINGTLLPQPIQGQKNFTIFYPKTMIMQSGEKWTISIIVKGLDVGIDVYTYTIYLESWSEGYLSDKKSIQLTVTHT